MTHRATVPGQRAWRARRASSAAVAFAVLVTACDLASEPRATPSHVFAIVTEDSGASTSRAVALSPDRHSVLREILAPQGESWSPIGEQSDSGKLWLWSTRNFRVVGLRAITPTSVAPGALVLFSTPVGSTALRYFHIGAISKDGRDVFSATLSASGGVALALLNGQTGAFRGLIPLPARQVMDVATAGACARAGEHLVTLVVDTSSRLPGGRVDSVRLVFIDTAARRVTRTLALSGIVPEASVSGGIVRRSIGAGVVTRVGFALTRNACDDGRVIVQVSLYRTIGQALVIPTDGSILLGDGADDIAAIARGRLLHYTTDLVRLPDVPVPPRGGAPSATLSLALAPAGDAVLVTSGLPSLGPPVFAAWEGRIISLRISDLAAAADVVVAKFVPYWIGVIP